AKRVRTLDIGPALRGRPSLCVGLCRERQPLLVLGDVVEIDIVKRFDDEVRDEVVLGDASGLYVTVQLGEVVGWDTRRDGLAVALAGSGHGRLLSRDESQ